MDKYSGKLQAFHEALQREHSIEMIDMFLIRLGHEVLLAEAMLEMAEHRKDELNAITPANILKQRD